MEAEGVIYVQLLDEGVDAWRPVDAINEGGGVYRLPDAAPPDEAWAFPPGSRVRCETRRLSGDLVQVACAVAD
jgi:hypothetical protein